jgi:hypothetical protein
VDAIRVKAGLLFAEAKATGDSHDLSLAAVLRSAISARSRRQCTDLVYEVAPYRQAAAHSSTDPSIVAEAFLDPLGKVEETREHPAGTPRR